MWPTVQSTLENILRKGLTADLNLSPNTVSLETFWAMINWECQLCFQATLFIIGGMHLDQEVYEWTIKSFRTHRPQFTVWGVFSQWRASLEEIGAATKILVSVELEPYARQGSPCLPMWLIHPETKLGGEGEEVGNDS